MKLTTTRELLTGIASHQIQTEADMAKVRVPRKIKGVKTPIGIVSVPNMKTVFGMFDDCVGHMIIVNDDTICFVGDEGVAKMLNEQLGGDITQRDGQAILMIDFDGEIPAKAINLLKAYEPAKPAAPVAPAESTSTADAAESTSDAKPATSMEPIAPAKKPEAGSAKKAPGKKPEGTPAKKTPDKKEETAPVASSKPADTKAGEAVVTPRKGSLAALFADIDEEVAGGKDAATDSEDPVPVFSRRRISAESEKPAVLPRKGSLAALFADVDEGGDDKSAFESDDDTSEESSSELTGDDAWIDIDALMAGDGDDEGGDDESAFESDGYDYGYGDEDEGSEDEDDFDDFPYGSSSAPLYRPVAPKQPKERTPLIPRVLGALGFNRRRDEDDYGDDYDEDDED